jgi:hypothetical protein
VSGDEDPQELSFARSAPQNYRLHPQARLDGYGRRAGQASTEISDWLRNVVGITDPNKPFYSHRHTATSYLRNTRLPDGSAAVKEDVERYLPAKVRMPGMTSN